VYADSTLDKTDGYRRWAKTRLILMIFSVSFDGKSGATDFDPLERNDLWPNDLSKNPQGEILDTQ
jgi:hypothetical protein